MLLHTPPHPPLDYDSRFEQTGIMLDWNLPNHLIWGTSNGLIKVLSLLHGNQLTLSVTAVLTGTGLFMQ